MYLRRILSQVDPHFLDILRGASLVFLLKVVGTGAAFATSILIARLLGASGLGIFSLAVTCMTIAAVVARLGLDNAVVNLVSAHAAQDDHGSAIAVHSAALKLALPASAATSLIFVAFAHEISTGLFGEPALTAPLRIAGITILPTTVLVLSSESLRALGQPGHATFLQGLMPPILTLFVIAVLLPFSIEWDPATMMLLKFVVAALAAAAAWVYWRTKTGRTSATKSIVSAYPLLSKSIPMLWIMLIGMTITTVDIFMLGIWVDSREIGLYSAAAQVANTMILLLVAINTVVAPKFSEFHVLGRQRDLSAIARNCTLFATVLGLPVYLIFVLFPEAVMGLFGEEFRSGSLYLAILATGQFINVATGSVSVLLMMTGNERTLQKVTITVGLLNIAFNALLIPVWGPAGAAVATAISVAALNITGLLMVYRKLSIKMISFGRL